MKPVAKTKLRPRRTAQQVSLAIHRDPGADNVVAVLFYNDAAVRRRGR